MADMAPDGWRRMLCVEAAVVGHPVVVPAGEEWVGRQTLAVV
jgi:glucose-6-phosphate 1-epimerase